MLNMLGVRVGDDIERRLAALSESTGRTKSFYVRQALDRYLDEMEALARAEAALRDIHSGKTTTVPLEELLEEFDM